MKSLLLDTNIWLDYFDIERAGHTDAFALIDTCLRHNIKLFVSSTTLKDFYYLSKATEKRALRECDVEITETAALRIEGMAKAQVDSITSKATVIACGHNDSRMALKLCRVHSDFEDNLVVAAAMRSGADLLVTNDEDLAKHAPVAACGAMHALEYINAGL